MADTNEVQGFARLVERLDPQSTLLRVWPLTGGVSAQVTAFQFARADRQPQTMLVRRHGVRDRQRNPQIAADEFKLLQFLQGAGIAAPAPTYLDQAGEFFATPCLVMEFIEGESDFAPTDLAAYFHQAATHLAAIHRIAGAQQDLAFLPRHTKGFGKRPATLDESLAEGEIRNALEALWPVPQVNPSVLLHGDFWPGNLLWQAGRLAAVIDWEDAAVGDPLADLGNTRLEMLWAFGRDAMTEFTHIYRSLNPIDLTNLPYWDLCAALHPAGRLGEWGLDPAVEKAMRTEHRWFITQAFTKLYPAQLENAIPTGET